MKWPWEVKQVPTQTSDATPEVFFGWDPAAPGCEETTCRCRCGCLHVWQDRAPTKCSSCGARFNWAGLKPVT